MTQWRGQQIDRISVLCNSIRRQPIGVCSFIGFDVHTVDHISVPLSPETDQRKAKCHFGHSLLRVRLCSGQRRDTEIVDDTSNEWKQTEAERNQMFLFT